MAQVYLSLGSNLGDRIALLRAAVAQMQAAGLALVATSPLYESEPWEEEPGHTESERSWFLNCVVAVETSLPPRVLLERLQAIEATLGRTRPPGLTPEARRFTPRPLDIDILFYEDQVISVPDDLHIPHLLAAERAFVLRPLADIAPDFTHPTLYRRVSELLDELADEHEVRRGAFPTHWLEG
ncbi:MAG TPA: 2-amino-4-hydroxy-6-hydroxymethyldihydropteridine diphosphokinase [Methylomirabilota bacterium]|jgi:2-amino-4-hydroxy-6-hydroxymethyldihydropteridine diphosphokinase|nr:2-amino-4-hydroxy-6-hydroxymethyldihydropteridine diphosphokinase [Methylomirabilota bacterium]